ncbi:putative bifunctional signaling protein/50S ribosomal protein L9 [Metamycoplasma arthritidis]|uniref:Uncharacterized protein n=1 Tax=Metamycoplasma arthritidis (strain 158L3-1) TaxID=243272 RepID=B3PN56_META1|nr:DHH family phosphoesterase [Metamycoplasma arthritidis]ACF07458.1 conserved hypothetical protein [Metamycoplasma arthritidis 158L3-1]VEU78979.1 putative bifunctional signaling protein/50S ribosomal protein L9 [Metamycoplasma arthritidis]
MVRDKKKIAIILEIIFLFIIPTISLFIVFFFVNHALQIYFGITYLFWIIAIGITGIIKYARHISSLGLVNESFNYYMEKELANFSIGMIAFSNDGSIVWISKFIENRFGRKIIGEDIKKIFNITEWKSTNLNFEFEKDNFFYQVNVYFEENFVSIKDITLQTQLLENYFNDRSVFGRLEIDNISLYQSTLSEADFFKINVSVLGMLDTLSKKWNFVYKNYENGKFFLITTQKILSEFEKSNFNFFQELANKKIIKNANITISAGFSYGALSLNALDALSKEALLESQARGGNQTTIKTQNERSRHYGSESEIEINLSRTNVNHIAKFLISKLSSDAIEKVIVYGHKNADLDAIGAAFGIYALAKHYDKRVFIQNMTYDDTASRMIDRIEKDLRKAFITKRQATSLNDAKTLVVIVDTASEDRIENPSAFTNILKDNIIVLDHHRINKTLENVYRENVYIDSFSSSASEIVTEIIALTNNSEAISPEIAQLLLNGIYLDTNRFQKQTSSKTFYASSLLQNWGAKTSNAVHSLKINKESFELINLLLKNTQEVKPGYFLAYTDREIPIDVISIAADEILRVDGRKAAFVVAKLPNKKVYKMSARGINTNVQVIAEAVNGGGHFSTAAAESDEDLDLFIDNIKQAISDVKDESNNN